MTTTALSNPAFALYESKVEVLSRARAALNARVEDVAPGISKVISHALVDRADRQVAPPIGEIWPWVLADLVGLEEQSVDPIVVPWIALYTYTILLDRQADNAACIDPAEVLAGSLLFDMGVSELWTFTSGSRWADVVRDSLRTAVASQIADVRFKRSLTDLEQKLLSAAGKNSGFVAGAAMFAAVATIDPTALVSFARSVLLPLQHLDDIADVMEDYESSNFTPLLVRAREYLPLSTDNAPIRDRSDDVLAALVLSGSLGETLAETRAVLGNAFDVVGKAYQGPSRTPAHQFLTELDRVLLEAEIEVDGCRRQLTRSDASSNDKRCAIGDVRRRILVVAQTS